MACVSLPPKLSERVVDVSWLYWNTELIIRVNTEFRVERFPRSEEHTSELQSR